MATCVTYLGQYLRRQVKEHGKMPTMKRTMEGIKTGKIAKKDISIRNLAEGMIGAGWERKLQNYKCGVGLREAVEAVDASGFAHITGQLLVQEIQAQYDAADMVIKKLIDEEQITNGNLGPQRVPFLGKITDAPSTVQQGMPYPTSGFLEQYIDYPVPQKFGEICNVTFEMIFSDLTKQVFDAAGNVGERCAIEQEERCTSVVYGLTNPFSWNGTTYSSFLTTGSWINKITGKVIQDWTDLNDIEILAAKMLDPTTNKPIKIRPTAALVQPYRWYNWKRIQEATGTKSGAYSQSGYTPQTDAPSPLEFNYPIFKSLYAQNLLTTAAASGGGGLTDVQAREYVVLADFKKAFVWRYVYPMTIVEAPPMNTAEFEQDITLRVKASNYGVCCVKNPRYAYLSVNT